MVHFDPTFDGIENPPTASHTPDPNRPTMAHRRSVSESGISRLKLQQAQSFGAISAYAAYRAIRQNEKQESLRRHGWENYDASSFRTFGTDASGSRRSWTNSSLKIDEEVPADIAREVGGSADESSPLVGKFHRDESQESFHTAATTDGAAWISLKEMFTESKINILFVFLPLAYYSHAAKWNDGSVFILNFLAMVPLASMLGVFTEELAAHTNDVIGGLINATFGNAVEMVVAIQALLAEDYRVVQSSLIGSVFSNLLLVLGMCFFCGGMKFTEQTFVAQGAVASIALLGFSGLALLIPAQFDNTDGVDDEVQSQDVTSISRVAALLLICMYAQLLFFQLRSHAHLFDGDDDVVALIPFHWALIGLVVITAIVTILSEYLVGSIDGFCDEFNLGRSFVGLIILPVVGNAVEHISAVSVAMKNKMDLALGGKFAIDSFLFIVFILWCFWKND